MSVAQMEARKVTLAAKQEMVEQAYQRALEKLCALPEEQYTAVLAALLVQASSTGAGGGRSSLPGGLRPTAAARPAVCHTANEPTAQAVARRAC